MCVYITMRELHTQSINGMQKYRGKNLNKTMINTSLINITGMGSVHTPTPQKTCKSNWQGWVSAISITNRYRTLSIVLYNTIRQWV